MLEDVQPSLYPALHRVLLIESRHGAKAESLKALKATNLFESVVEPATLAEGLAQLKTLEFDACIVGSSVKREKAAEFLRDARLSSLSADCAFIVLVSEGDEAFVMSDAHSTILWPASKQEFFRGIILGVVKANANSPWASIAKGEAEEEQTDSAELDRQTISSVLSGSSLVDLQAIARRIASKDLALDPDGRPNLQGQAALARVVEKMFAANTQSVKIKAFREYFTAALELWFVDCARYSVEVGTNNLRRSLMTWTQE